MSLLDKAARSLALRAVRGKLDKARKRGSAVLKLLDGNKRLLVVLGFVVSSFVAMLTGQDVSQWLDLALRAFGWTDASAIASAKELSTQIVPLLFAIWAAVSGLRKIRKQWKAGATPTEINSPIGVVKAAVADGTLALVVPSRVDAPTVLEMSGVPVVAQVNGKQVIP